MKTALDRDFSVLFLSVALLLITSSAFSQDNKTKTDVQKAEDQLRIWQTRVDDLTKSAASDAAELSAGEQSFYLALLAKVLWKDNQTEARIHLKKSAQKVLSGLETEEKAEIAKNLKSTQKSLDIIFGLDEALGMQIVSKLEAALEAFNVGKKREDPEMAELFASIGVRVAKANPRLAFACGIDSLVYGFASALPALVVELNLHDNTLAESLVRRALLLASGKYTNASYLLVFNLNRSIAEFNKGKAFSSGLHKSAVEVFADLLAGAAAIEQERRGRCGIAFYAPAILPRIDEYVPGQSLPFRQNLQTCIPFTSPATQGMTTIAASTGFSESVDDLLRAAKETKDVELKVRYYRRALSKLKDDKDYEGMISLLDGFDGDDYKKISPVGWDNWRIDASSSGALASFESNDLPATYRFIDRTPKRLRPDVRSRLISKAPVVKNKEFYSENLDEMQKELNSLELSYADKANFYRGLAHHYLRIRPTESELMFRNAVKYINKADTENPDFIPEKDWGPAHTYVAVESDLIELDYLSITRSLDSVSSPRSRIRLRLGLLESSLKKYVEAKKRLDDLKKRTRPGP